MAASARCAFALCVLWLLQQQPPPSSDRSSRFKGGVDRNTAFNALDAGRRNGTIRVLTFTAAI